MSLKDKRETDIQKKISITSGMLSTDPTFRTIIESISEGVVVVDKEGKIIMINGRLENLLGYTKEELFGKPLGILLLSEQQETHKKYIHSFFKNPRIRPMGLGYEVFAFSKLKKKIPVEISLSYLKNSTDNISLAFISDISKRKEIENKLLEKNKALDAFAHTVAHDLKASLNSIIGFSDILYNDESIDSNKRQELLQYINNSGNKMNDIIDALLFMAKVDNSEVALETIDMEQLIINVLNRHHYEIRQKNAQVELQKKKSIVHALGYGPWVEEVVFNLVGNALKHGGESPKISIRCKEKDNQVTYFIQNSGNLLSKEKIAELHKTISDVKIEAASGFGLSIVHRILQKLNGELHIDSSQEEGNIFSFSLPKK